MKKSVKLISIFLSLLLLFSMSPFTVFAEQEEPVKLYITHINESSSGKEGAALVLTPDVGETVQSKGNFAWWRLVTFEWDATENCYKVTNIQLNANNQDKSTTKIPENGFVYAINTGNDYSSSGGINYRTERILNCFASLQNVTVGTKAYVYNTDLKNGAISTNGLAWYNPNYVTNSYITLGAPDSTGTPYDPNNAEEILIQYTIGLTHINTTTYQTGMSKIFTKAFGTNILSQNTAGKYQWWKVAIFDWDDRDGCYKVVSIDTNIGNNYEKYAMIPENGFAIAVITGNNVTDAASSAMDKLKIGNKAYLYGVDVANGTMGENAKITINLPDTSLTPYTPAITNRLAAPVITNMPDGKAEATKAGFTIEWSAVEGATGYVVNINNSSVTNNGPFIVESKTVTGTSYTIGENVLEVGNSYTISVYAVGTGRSASMLARAKLFVISDEAQNSNLRTKKIVAFGDSLTARGTWINLLAGRFGAEFINAGVGGDKTTEGIARFQKQVLDEDPDIVIINFGMNDQAVINGNPLVPVAKYTENLEYFAKTLIEAGADVIFVTPNKVCTEQGYHNPGPGKLDYGTDSMLAYCDAMRKVAMKYGCGLVDINYECSFEDLTKFCASGDGVHQSEYGHQKYAEFIGNYLAAVYDNKNLATVAVKFEDESGNSLAETVTLKGAVGANIMIPGMDIDGYRLTSSPVNYKFSATPGSVTMKYAPVGIELKEDSRFTIEGDYIIINAEMLTVEGLLSQVKTSGVACTLSSGNNVGTGTKLQLKSGSEVLSELTIILPGDVDGDGEISSFDYLKVKRYILGNDTLKDAYLTAADTDKDKVIDSVDYLNIKRHIIGSKPLF